MRVVLQRDFNGIGDWLMALACLKMMNRQRPDIEAWVNFQTRAVLPGIVRQFFDMSDVKVRGGMPPSPYHLAHNLVYRKWPPDSYIESMLLNLNDLCGLHLQYEPGVYPSWNMRWSGGDYLVMVSQGKRRERINKEWGTKNFTALTEIFLRAGVRVVQIGALHDARLPVKHGDHHLGRDFATILRVLCGARGFVGIENGMMVLCGFLGVPQVTIYDGWPMSARSDYARQLKLKEPTEPAKAFEQAMIHFEYARARAA